MLTLATLRRYAIARSLFSPTTLQGAIDRLGYVQADPIRAPARAQDLILRQRVRGYRAGDLEQHYPKLAVEEDYFVNYGFIAPAHLELMHPRIPRRPSSAAARRQMQALLQFATERGEVHPRAANAHFQHGRVSNYWGGASSATTMLLDRMHYQGLLRVARREDGIRIYAARSDAPAVAEGAERQAEALLHLAVRLYAPLPAASLGYLTSRLAYAAPQLYPHVRRVQRAAEQSLAHGQVAGTRWYWPADETPQDFALAGRPRVRLLAPFDPVVWDRRRFEQFWGWAYRFEAYTPKPKRKLGYYALPLLWHERVIGWGNLSVKGDRLLAEMGYCAARPPRGALFKRELAAELARTARFLGIAPSAVDIISS
jgi:uncharacterized protein YcaQ